MVRKLLVVILCVSMLFCLTACGLTEPKMKGTEIKLSDSKITVDGKEITSDTTRAVYSAKDIVFYLANQGITYGEGAIVDEHQQEDADKHTVVHITKPGTYILSGKLSLGQIAVDLGEGAETDPNAVVTLVLNGVDITCQVAPAIIFYHVYECGSRDAEAATKDVDTSKAGANVIIADGTENNITGSYVAKIYESCQLNADGTEVVESKKLHKYDGAFYSKMSMNIFGGKEGDGVLNIFAENEGLDSELHLTIGGGIINITSGNDGINTNEDNVSVTTVNGGILNILCSGETEEGDGIDSNGYLVINGGTVIAQGCATSGDAGIDSDKGIYINGGKVLASGNMLDRIAGGDGTYAVFGFTKRQAGSSLFVLETDAGEVVLEYAPTNAFTYLIMADENLTAGEYTIWQGDTPLEVRPVEDIQQMPPVGEKPEKPEGALPEGTPPQMPDGQPPQGPGPGIPEAPEMPESTLPPDFVIPGQETTTVFPLEKGANYFVVAADTAFQ